MESSKLSKAENHKIKVFENASENEKYKFDVSFYFIQAADPQFGICSLRAATKTSADSDKYSHEEDVFWARKMIAQVNAMQPRPAFLIVCGDQVHDPPNKPHRTEQLRDFHKVFSELHADIPLLCVCGNHDVGDAPSELDMRDYRAEFGNDYYSFWIRAVKCIVINSQCYKVDTDAMSGESGSAANVMSQLREEQLIWLREQLEDARLRDARHILVFQHIPWFLKQSDEDDQYFNIPKAIRMEMLDLLSEYSVSKVFCGHFHNNAGGWYKKVQSGSSSNEASSSAASHDLEVVVTSAVSYQIGDAVNGFRVVKVLENEVSHEYVAIE